MNKYFNELVDFVGSRPKPFKNKKKYISTGALKANNISEDDVEMVDYETRPSRANLEVENGDILFAKMAFTDKRLLVGEIEANYIYSSGFFAVKPKAGILTSKCLFYLLNSETFRNQKDINSTGATQKAITIEGLKKVSLRIPEYHRQNHIGTMLESIDKVIKLKALQLSEYDQLIKSRFVEMFGDIQNNSKQYRNQFLKDICSIKTGGTPSRNHPEYFEGTIPWITTVALGKLEIDKLDAIELITEDAVNNSSTKIIPAGSILFGTRVGVGKTSINKVDLCTNQDIAAITEISKDYNIIFLKKVLDSYSEYFNNQKRGATIQGITTDTLKNIHIPIIDLEIQKEFAAFFEQVDKLKFVVQKSLDETQKLFDSLMQEYFG